MTLPCHNEAIHELRAVLSRCTVTIYRSRRGDREPTALSVGLLIARRPIPSARHENYYLSSNGVLVYEHFAELISIQKYSSYVW